MTQPETINVDPQEIDKFARLAGRWWDPKGSFRPLHDMNPVRFDWICSHAAVAEKKTLDVGCGGGLLTEAMAKAGADVTGLDMGEEPLNVARLHALEENLTIEYLQTTAEALAAEQPASFDIVTCLEMLEHVPDPAAVVLACAQLVKPGGNLFFSTINRNAKSWLLAIVGAEYVLNLLPKGTHEYAKLIKPSELADFCRTADLQVRHIQGISYDPFRHGCTLTRRVDVNYLMHCVKPALQ